MRKGNVDQKIDRQSEEVSSFLQSDFHPWSCTLDYQQKDMIMNTK